MFLLIFHDVVPTMAHGSSPRTSHANKCTDLRTCSFQFVEDSDTACSLCALPLPDCLTRCVWDEVIRLERYRCCRRDSWISSFIEDSTVINRRTTRRYQRFQHSNASSSSCLKTGRLASGSRILWKGAASSVFPSPESGACPMFAVPESEAAPVPR